MLLMTKTTKRLPFGSVSVGPSGASSKKEDKVKKNTSYFTASYQRSERVIIFKELPADKYLQKSTVSQLFNNHQSGTFQSDFYFGGFGRTP